MNEVRDDVVSWDLAEEMLNTIDYLKFKLELWEQQASNLEKKRIERAMKLFYKSGKRFMKEEEYDQ